MRDWRTLNEKSLLIVLEKINLNQHDIAVKPCILISTSGRFGKETQLENVWLGFLDLKKLQIIHYQKLNFRYLPSQCGCYSASAYFSLAASSHPTWKQDADGKKVLIQNYQVVCNSFENSIHEILEF